MAVVTALAVGVSSFPFRRYAYWSAWNGWWLVLGGLLFSGVQGVAGLVGAALANATSWSPTRSTILNGVLFGLAGGALLRVHLEDFGIGDMNRANTAMHLFMQRLVDWMDELAQRRVESYLDSLNDAQFVHLTRRVDYSYMRVNASKPQITRFVREVKKAINEMRHSEREISQHGREVIRGILLEWYVKSEGTWRVDSEDREGSSNERP